MLPPGVGSEHSNTMATSGNSEPQERCPDSISVQSESISCERSDKEATAFKLPAYKSLRYEEDYRYLKDPSRHTDIWDPIKYIPFGDQKDSYLSIGGQIRPWYEFYRNAFFGSGPPSNSYLLQRYFLHGDLHLGEDFRVFTQISSNFENGRIGGPRPDIDENNFALLQAFADYSIRWDEKDSLTFRAGRYEMEYGSSRLVSTREGTNVPLSFLGPKVLLRTGDWAVDGFWTKPVLNKIDAFDDEVDPQRQFWGIYTVHPLDSLPDGHIDLYYFGLENKHAIFAQGAGYELRHTVGSRLWGKPKPWDYNFEFVWQFGRFGQGQIEAWSVASAIGYTVESAPLRPRFSLRADIVSGDNDPNSPNLQTLNPLFPKGAYFNEAVQIGPQNLIDVHPAVTLHFGEKASLLFDWDFYWRESLNDGIYSISGQPIRPGQPSQARYVASAPQIVFSWFPTRNITFKTAYVHYFAGSFLKDTPPGKDVDYVATYLTYKF